MPDQARGRLGRIRRAVSFYRWLNGPGWPSDKGRIARWRTAWWLVKS